MTANLFFKVFDFTFCMFSTKRKINPIFFCKIHKKNCFNEQFKEKYPKESIESRIIYFMLRLQFKNYVDSNLKYQKFSFNFAFNFDKLNLGTKIRFLVFDNNSHYIANFSKGYTKSERYFSNSGVTFSNKLLQKILLNNKTELNFTQRRFNDKFLRNNYKRR